MPKGPLVLHLKLEPKKSKVLQVLARQLRHLLRLLQPFLVVEVVSCLL
jgi:hypothetical protein